ncbi:DUF6069 family protein [Actinomadura rayongensis]|uniref:Uncharacterized protein n=1 Tax=Actinomadura rayongensis TaxID=1429076 RepID=A0A6I4WEG7_9ACTN|nr:DUF6069 family protein [Actinomadura rayongensis]MXQ68198.1 hypothetical protein [Actinomadura rayongensis]
MTYGDGRSGVQAGRLWAGGVATAVVAGFVGAVGVLVARGVLDIPVWLPAGENRVADASALGVALTGAVAALVATAVLHLLMATTPSPRRFFGWIVALATVVAMVWPFTLDMSLPGELAGAVIAGLTGLAIGSLLTSVAVSASRP